MHEGFIFSARIFMKSLKYAESKLRNINIGEDLKEKIKKRYQRQYYFDMLARYMEIDPNDPKLIQKDEEIFYEDEVEVKYKKVYEEQIKELKELDKRRLIVPFKFCSRLMDKFDVIIKKGKAQINPSCSFIIIQEIFQEILFYTLGNLNKIFVEIKENN